MTVLPKLTNLGSFDSTVFRRRKGAVRPLKTVLCVVLVTDPYIAEEGQHDLQRMVSNSSEKSPFEEQR